MKRVGAYRWRYEPDWIDGLDNGSWVAEWDDDATPTCETCADYGEWVGEDSEVEPCPSCGGDSATAAIESAKKARRGRSLECANNLPPPKCSKG